MTHKTFQLHFKILQTKYKRFEIVIFSTGVSCPVKYIRIYLTPYPRGSQQCEELESRFCPTDILCARVIYVTARHEPL